MIAETAYFLAQERGLSGGDPVTDWIEAERKVDRHADVEKLGELKTVLRGKIEELGARGEDVRGDCHARCLAPGRREARRRTPGLHRRS